MTAALPKAARAARHPRRAPRSRMPFAIRLLLQFLWAFAVWKVIRSLTFHEPLLSPEAWTTVDAWVYPLGFAVISVYACWHFTAKNEDLPRRRGRARRARAARRHG